MVDRIPFWTWQDFTWTELNGGAHTYPVYLNLWTGEYFNSDRIATITAKCAGLILGRPIHSLCKTLYHLLILPITVVLAPKAFLDHLVDIVRTPIYGIVLTALAIVGLILGLFDSEKIYDLRLFMGKIEQSLNRGEKHTEWTLAPCFQPGDLNNIDTIWGKTEFKDTTYPNEQRGKVNYARAKIIHDRKLSCPLPLGRVQTLQVS